MFGVLPLLDILYIYCNRDQRHDSPRSLVLAVIKVELLFMTSPTFSTGRGLADMRELTGAELNLGCPRHSSLLESTRL